MRFGFLSDTHLGYQARCRNNNATGRNERVQDGFDAFEDTVTDMIEHNVDAVLHGGDLFHVSHPSVDAIAFARTQLDRLYAAGIPFYGITGNHDFANDRRKKSATVVVQDTARNIQIVDTPYEKLHIGDGLTVHAVSHLGVISGGADRVDPEPDEDGVNFLMSHGAVQTPDLAVFSCIDSPGEAIITSDILTDEWDASLLGHYHSRGAIKGFEKGRGQAWYAGSALRRGFSDEPGERGWLQVDVTGSGVVTVAARNVKQRPQFDLPPIDANKLTGAEVEERIRRNLASVDLGDALVRQKVTNCPLHVRRGIDRVAINTLAQPALMWDLSFSRPEQDAVDEKKVSLATAGAANVKELWRPWVDDYVAAHKLSDTVKQQLLQRGEELLTGTQVQVSETKLTVVEDEVA